MKVKRTSRFRLRPGNRRKYCSLSPRDVSSVEQGEVQKEDSHSSQNRLGHQKRVRIQTNSWLCNSR